MWPSLFVLAVLVDLLSLNHHCLCLGKAQIALSTQGCLSAESWTFMLGCRHFDAIILSNLAKTWDLSCTRLAPSLPCKQAIPASVRSESLCHFYTDFTTLHWFHTPDFRIYWTETKKIQLLFDHLHLTYETWLHLSVKVRKSPDLDLLFPRMLLIYSALYNTFRSSSTDGKRLGSPKKTSFTVYDCCGLCTHPQETGESN